ncbi:polysaccharide pyruvyl transferase family protein [Wenzhouxiangella limi]|uniref:Polysaccharide pyruvyl transferase family protein n=1 Tax=Wenzhouxiangella limi TaxID=2707351 RepID=A0A845V0Q0_9GAMM|nr:polysaccharide pyruvyl transferase family protein [Wenzhouxiangella limi]NDY96304.1 polysaccharide pyruvyl transferase family protein [Wenzhouxiangella limi]
MSNLFWWKGKNVGDNVTPYLYRKMTGNSPRFYDLRAPRSTHHEQLDNIVATGSILEYANAQSTVWGAGFISARSRVPSSIKNVLAVRGPLTREKLLKGGFPSCPENYGDPGLLVSQFYRSRPSARVEYGLIPHQVDHSNPVWQRLRDMGSCKVLDVSTDNVEEFLASMLECEVIVSSSLHGIVFADSFQIPNVAINLNTKVQGNGFKFMDYLSSVGRSLDYLISDDSGIETQISRLLDRYTAVNFNSNDLLDVCPWINS